MTDLQKHTCPDERIASFDILDISNTRHHMSALLECDVSEVRAKIRSMRRQGAPVSIGVGAITSKPGVVGSHILIVDVLHLTRLIDHDVIDGAPMARMTNRLVKNIERRILL